MYSAPSGCFIWTGSQFSQGRTPPRARVGRGTGRARGRRKLCPLIAPRCHCCLLTSSFPSRHGNISSPSPVLDGVRKSWKTRKRQPRFGFNAGRLHSRSSQLVETSLDVVAKEINKAENLVRLLHYVATAVVCTGIWEIKNPLITGILMYTNVYKLIKLS